jgi:hypothetical protein
MQTIKKLSGLLICLMLIQSCASRQNLSNMIPKANHVSLQEIYVP